VIAYGKRPARTAGKGNFGFRLLSRLAVAVQFTLPGERVTGLDVQGVDINVSPVGAVLQLDLANSGNSLIKTTTGRLHVTKDGRPLFSPKVKLGTFLPKTEIRYPLPWPGTPVEGTYHVSGVLRPRGAPPVRIDTDVKFGKTRIREFRQETGRQAVETSRTPVWIWALLGLALAAVLALLLLLLRSRRRGDDDHVAATRPPSYPPPVELAHIPVPSMREHVPVAVADVPFSGGGGDDGLVDLNTATVEELTQLPGIGPRAADRIVAHREEYGRFESVEGLCAVEGFDKKRIRGLDEHATV
jgi:competence ComEA-like helix-hairpin-helix protein